MSLQHVFRAEKLGRAKARDEKNLRAILEGPDLSEVRSEAGCNMLQVYLLARWGSGFGDVRRLSSTEDFQNEVVDAYLRAGCSVDTVAPSREFATHTGPSVAYGDLRFVGDLSALGIVSCLREQADPDAFEALHEQLLRLEYQLGGEAADSQRATGLRGLDEAHAMVIHGVCVRLPAGAVEIEDYRTVADALGLTVVLGADMSSLAEQDEVEVLVGLALVHVTSEDDGPRPVFAGEDLAPNAQRWLETIGEVACHLVAYGPLATAYLVRGKPAKDGEPGEFYVGSSVSQERHNMGASGELVASVHLGARGLPQPLNDDSLLLLVRYD